ncbi:MAG TPA: hypothetical protein DDW50_16500 [Firmicutes bacterium]|nr:hypothetical protein [Bacillota bacterium]
MNEIFVRPVKGEKLMIPWSKNNRACTTTWSTLLILDQISAPFVDSSVIKMQEFTFWNHASSSDMRRILATTLAIQMDNIFIMIRGAQYETGITKETVTSGIAGLLTDGDKTVNDLADLNDSNYVFWTGDNTHEN